MQVLKAGNTTGRKKVENLNLSTKNPILQFINDIKMTAFLIVLIRMILLIFELILPALFLTADVIGCPHFYIHHHNLNMNSNHPIRSQVARQVGHGSSSGPGRIQNWWRQVDWLWLHDKKGERRHEQHIRRKAR